MIVAFALAPLILLGTDPLPAPWRDPGRNRLVWIQSPFVDGRPDPLQVDTIVLHATAGPTLEGTTRWFQDPKARVSAHYTVGKDGSIVQHVSTFNRAWHAGVSKDSEGREGVNAFSVGIEIVNTNTGKEPYTDAQYDVVDNLIGMLVRRFPTIKYLTSHKAIAQPAGRKSDPAGFDWERLDRWKTTLRLVP